LTCLDIVPAKLIKFIQVEKAFQRLNIIFCELSSLLALATSSTPDGPQRAAGGKVRRTSTSNPAPKSALSIQIKLVCQYAVRLLDGEAVTSQLGRTLTPQAYIALLSTIWSLLNTSVHGSSSPTLQAVLEHGIGTSSSAALKLPTIEFLGRIALVRVLIIHHCMVGDRLSYLSARDRAIAISRFQSRSRKRGRSKVSGVDMPPAQDPLGTWFKQFASDRGALGEFLSSLSLNKPSQTILRLLLRLKLRKSRLIDGDVMTLTENVEAFS
jgi:hypothetical protein